MRALLIFAGLMTLSGADDATVDAGTAAFVAQEASAGHYLSPPGSCAPSGRDLYGWSRAELLRCRYEVIDRLPGGKARVKAGIVYLANPPADRVLKWLITACRRARPAALSLCVRNGASEIRGASGTQFPVAGLVWEDMAGTGINKGYVFRNGVTVRTTAFRNDSEEPPADDAALEAIASAQSVTGVNPTRGYARIMSTSRAEFARFTGRGDIPVGREDAASAIFWSDLVGKTYREALSSDENPLISAHLCGQAGAAPSCNGKR